MNERESCRKYYLKNKEKILAQCKKRYAENKDKINANLKIKRKMNRERWRVYELKAKKKWRTKNPVILKTESLRRKTARLFPLKDKICEICKEKPAIHHHHNTLPYRYDKFLYVCYDCHVKEDKKLLGDKKNAYSYMER